MQFTFGVFLKPVSATFHWPRSKLSLAFTIGLFLTAVCAPAVGGLIDRFGIRRVIIPLVALFSLSLVATALLTHSVASFTLFYALMGIGAAGQTPLPYAKVVSAWFDRRRGLALGIAISGVGVGTALVPLLAQSLISAYSWRIAYLGLAVTLTAVAIPTVLLLIRMPPAADAGRIRPALMTQGASRQEALRSKQFWIIAVTFLAVSAATNGAVAHVVPLLTDRGISASAAARALALAGVALIIGRVAAGFLADQFFAPRVTAAFALLPAVGTLLLTVTSNNLLIRPAIIAIGLGLGAEVSLGAVLLSRYFGLRSFGELYGYLFALFMLGAGAGPFIMGALYDRLGSYTLCLSVFAATLVAASVVVLQLGTYRYPPTMEPSP